jgi:hypothetical protein
MAFTVVHESAMAQNSCMEGYVLYEDGWCIPADANYCGDGKYCESNQLCTWDDACLDYQHPRVCSDLDHYCPYGYVCSELECVPEVAD